MLKEELAADMACLRAVAAELAEANKAGSTLPGEAGRNVHESEFSRFALRNPAVLFPAIRLQSALRSRLGGNKLHIAIAQRKLRTASLTAGSGLSAATRALNDAVGEPNRAPPACLQPFHSMSCVRCHALTSCVMLWPDRMRSMSMQRGVLTCGGSSCAPN